MSSCTEVKQILYANDFTYYYKKYNQLQEILYNTQRRGY